MSSRSNRYSVVASDQDDTNFSIELGRSVPFPESRQYHDYHKDTETFLSEPNDDYFKMDDLFKKDIEEFVPRASQRAPESDYIHDDLVTKVRESTNKLIEEIPDSVASKYGEMLTNLVGRFIDEHLELQNKYEELLRKKDSKYLSKNSNEDFLVKKLMEKLTKYRNQQQVDQQLIEEKDKEIAELKRKLALQNSSKREPVPPVTDQSARETDTVDYDTKIALKSEEPNYSQLIEQLKMGMSKIELEEELRLKKELQEEQYKILKKQFEELQDSRKRASKQVLNRDLDQFKQDLKKDLAELLTTDKGSTAPDQSTVESKSEGSDDLLNKLQIFLHDELKMNNKNLEEKFKVLLADKVSRSELKSFFESRQIYQEEVTTHCHHCASTSEKPDHAVATENLEEEIEDISEKLRIITNEISRLESYESLDKTELIRLVTEKHSLIHKLKYKKQELEANQILRQAHILEEPPEDSDNCHTINILRDNAKKFGISLKKNTDAF